MFAMHAEAQAPQRFKVHAEGFGAWSEPLGESALPDNVNIVGDDGLLPVRRYAEVTMRATQQPISYRLRRAPNGAPEQVFEIPPEADAEALSLRFEGVDAIAPAEGGALELQLGKKTATWSEPKAWQYAADQSIEPVKVRYRIDGRRVAFRFGRYDQTRALHVDPYLARSYHGGSGVDRVEQMRQSRDGNWVVEGYSESSSFMGWGGLQGGYRYLSRISGDLRRRQNTLIFGEPAAGDRILKFVQDKSAGKWFIASHDKRDADRHFENVEDPGSLVIRRFDELLSVQEASLVAPYGVGFEELRALAIDEAGRRLYTAGLQHWPRYDVGFNGIPVGAEFVLSDWAVGSGFVLSMPQSLSGFERITMTQRMVPDGLVVGGQDSVIVLVAADGKPYGLGDRRPLLPGTNVTLDRYSLSLETLLSPIWLNGSGVVEGTHVVYDATNDEVVLAGRSNARDLPQGSEQAARAQPFGETDLFVARFTPRGVLKALSFAGSLGFDKPSAAPLITSDSMILLGHADLAAVPTADSHVLPARSNAMHETRSLAGASLTKGNFVTRMSRDLSRIERSAWLPQTARDDLYANRVAMAAQPGSAVIGLGGDVKFIGSCGNLTDSNFTGPSAAQPVAAGGCSEGFAETLTSDLAAPIVLPGGTCANTATTNCGKAIPDNSPFNNWLDSNKPVMGCGYVRGLRVGLDIAHTWIGDLTVTLVAPDGTQRQLLNRPGRPERNLAGCNSDHVRAVFDDTAGIDAHRMCADAPPASHAMLGTFLPAQPLAGFVGKVADGSWRLRVVDSAAADTGTLKDWSLEVDCAPTPPRSTDLEASFVSLVAPGIGNTIVPGLPFSWTARVRNLGPVAVTGARLQSDLRGDFSNVSFSCLATAGASCITPNGTGGLVQADVNLGVNATAEITITATPAATLDSPLVAGYADIYRPSALGAIGLDPNTQNNRAQWTAPIHRVADLRVVPLGVPAAAAPGGSVPSVQFTVQNDGPSRVLDALVRLIPRRNVAIESLVCTPGTSASASVATYTTFAAELTAMVSPGSEGFLLCDASLRISASAQPGDTARIAFAVNGSSHTDGNATNNSHEHVILVVPPLP
jgi:subtilisin-like proprotein convertase family protein